VDKVNGVAEPMESRVDRGETRVSTMVKLKASAQNWNAEDYAANARFVAVLGQGVLDLLDPQVGEHILDLGCGDGALTSKIKDLGAIITGVDSSSDLLEAAQAQGLHVRLMDGEKLTFNQEFDAVFSNAALHWMLDSRAVINGVKKSLKPGGRFVGEFGGHGNVAAISTALIAVLNKFDIDGAARMPWFFPSVENYRAQLRDAGFEVRSIALIPRPTRLPGEMRVWLNTFANPFLRGLDEQNRSAILDEVVSLLATTLKDESGNWTADYVRLRFDARKPVN
jgi:trans-aconitate methyltransferase